MSNSTFLHIRLSMMPYIRRPGTKLWCTYFIYSVYYRSWIASYGLSISAVLDKKIMFERGGGGKKALAHVFEAKRSAQGWLLKYFQLRLMFFPRLFSILFNCISPRFIACSNRFRLDFSYLYCHSIYCLFPILCS